MMIFLLVCSTPPNSLLWLHHVVISLVGRWSSDLRATFPIKFSCRVSIFFKMLGISNNFLLTVAFVMCWSFTSAILMPNMRRMLRCRNSSRFFRRDVRSAQLSRPHSNILMIMLILDLKMKLTHMELEDSDGIHWARMESIIGFLTDVARKYRDMHTYLKGRHLMQDSWIP